MKHQRGVTLIVLILFIVAIACVIGWGMNAYKLTKCDFISPYKCEVIRSIGLIPPIGAITGYITIEDGTRKENTQND